MRRTLRSPPLRRILIAYTINRLGNWLGLVALSLAVFDQTHSALSVAALLFAWQALPAFVVPAVVARVEASPRRNGLSRVYFFEALVTAGLAALVWHFSLPAVLVLAALDGTAALAANALLRAEVARIARDEAGVEGQEVAERNANAALNVAFSFSFVAGPVIGGAVSAAAGVPVAMLIDVATFLVCGTMLLDLRPHVEEVASSVRSRLRAAWTHINANPSLRALLVIDTTAFVFIQAGSPIEVPYLKETLHGGDSGYGLFVTVWGAGAVAGSIVFARSGSRALAVLLSTAIIALGAAFVGFAAAPSVLLACVAAFIGGAGNGLYVPSIISLVQRLTPHELHGRLMGAVESLGALAVALGLPLGGTLVAVSSPRSAFLTLGVATLAIGAAYVRLAVTQFGPARAAGSSAPLLAGSPEPVTAILRPEPPPE